MRGDFMKRFTFALLGLLLPHVGNAYSNFNLNIGYGQGGGQPYYNTGCTNGYMTACQQSNYNPCQPPPCANPCWGPWSSGMGLGMGIYSGAQRVCQNGGLPIMPVMSQMPMMPIMSTNNYWNGYGNCNRYCDSRMQGSGRNQFYLGFGYQSH